MSAEDEILFEVKDGVGVVTLNRPKRLNSVTWDLAARSSRSICFTGPALPTTRCRVIVLTGAGRRQLLVRGETLSGSSGDADSRPMPGPFRRPASSVTRSKTPAGPFAGVRPHHLDPSTSRSPSSPPSSGPAAWAPVMAFALACDRRFGDKTTRMSAAMVRLGFAPDCGITYFLPRVARLRPIDRHPGTNGR